jgi:hypothetical protein
MTRVPVALVIAAATAVGSRAYAQQPAAAPSDTTALAKQTQNPVGDLISVPLQFNFNTGGDLSDATLFNLNIQPVIPFKLTPDWNVIARAIVPIDSMPASNGTSYSGAGDIQLQLYLTPSKPGAFIYGVGPVFSFPTATALPVRTGTWAAGLGFVALTMKGPWVIGGLINQYWPLSDRGGEPKTYLLRAAARGQLQLRRRQGDVVFARDHRKLGRVRRQPMDGATGARHHEDHDIQRAADERRAAVLRQRRATRRVGRLSAAVRHLPALSRRAISR